MVDDAILCSLDEEGFAARGAEWRAVRTRALRSEEAEPGRVVSVHEPGPGVAGALRRLVEAEEVCCPLMEFSVEESADGVRLEPLFPPDAEAVMGSSGG